MSQFEKTRWVENQFAQDYRDDAGIYLPYRKEFFDITRRLMQYFHPAKKELRVLDLGCGDGLFVEVLLQECEGAKVVLLDGSAEMLASAKRRLAGKEGLEFVLASFQEVRHSDPLVEHRFDFIFSSLAIHHLTLAQKMEVYRYAFEHLLPSGNFLNYDSVLAPTVELEALAMNLWRIWIEGHQEQEQAKRLLDIPEKYQANTDNIPDTLYDQLDGLRKVGFKEVDCFFKYGPFSLFGGRRSQMD